MASSQTDMRPPCKVWTVWAPTDIRQLARRFKAVSRLSHGQRVQIGWVFRHWLLAELAKAEADCRRRGIPLPDDDETSQPKPFQGVRRADIDDAD